MPSSKLNTITWMLIILYVQLSKDLVQGCTDTRTDTKTSTANEKSSDPKPHRPHTDAAVRTWMVNHVLKDMYHKATDYALGEDALRYSR